MIPPVPAPAVAITPLAPALLFLTKMLASKGQFGFVVKGGIIGLTAATLAILLIWVHEMRRGRIW